MSEPPSFVVSAATPDNVWGVGGGVSPGASASASASEKNATGAASAGPTPSPDAAPAPKRRSCVTCRARKVRCDKLSPCSNCRRGKIECIFPSGDKPPRWTRRLDRFGPLQGQPQPAPAAHPGVNQVMDRLRTLEGLVKELSGQLEHANAVNAAHASGTSGPPSQADSPGSSSQGRDPERIGEAASSAAILQQQFGRLVLQDASSRSRYVASGFWSRINDEINGLKMDTQGLAGEVSDDSLDEDAPETTPATQERDRTPADRHAFLFRHSIGASGPSLEELRPLPSQIPFLLDVFYENINQVAQLVHMPTIRKMIREVGSSRTAVLTPANEALMFSIYYSAVTSMEEEDVTENFGTSKAELNMQYRIGLEMALARADFMSVSDLTIVQAFVIFLLLVRRHDSPRYVWMMTGLAIRMGQALGLQRDGSNLPQLTPYEVEIRRRVWWTLCILDVRTSEDQGTDLSIGPNSFDTKWPLNINESDISPETKETPQEREGVTDMSFSIIMVKISHITRKMVKPGPKDGKPSDMVNLLWEAFDEGYLKYSNGSKDIKFWVGAVVARLVMAKMDLLVSLPVLFSSPSDHFTDELRTKLLISAIEVAEYNHALNAEQACRQWRWIYQTYTHWHAVVYMLIEIPRRPWSPIVERAWVALHSAWLIPRESKQNKNDRIWFPLRKLMIKAQKRRETEIARLRGNPQAARQVEIEDANIPHPQTAGPISAAATVDLFLERWRRLVGLAEAPAGTAQPTVPAGLDNAYSSAGQGSREASQPSFQPTAAYAPTGSFFQGSYPATQGSPASLPLAQDFSHASMGTASAMMMPSASSDPSVTFGLSSEPFLAASNPFIPMAGDWPDPQATDPNLTPWLWQDTDVSPDAFASMGSDDLDINMDLDGDMNWYNWVESAKGMETAWNGSGGAPPWGS
ncbi:hypothetical protein GQ53DRAFT_808873 [Thozetella sp. PMI_491]|nr:hypothetical protein GQ53DRAFT_808873 [Thozetella sp. PMI_491]